MCAWGSNQKLEKFYKGAQSDTPWNKVSALLSMETLIQSQPSVHPWW
jgi:hypothetical protein